MRRTAVSAWALVLACAICVCACEPDPQVTTAALRLRSVPSCPLGPLEGMVVRATGDFPATEEVLLEGGTLTLDAFPSDTRYVVLELREGARAVAGVMPLAGRDEDRPLLLLPLSRSCPLGDPGSAAPPGAAVAGLPDGSLLIAGGGDETGGARSRAVVLPAGADLAVAVPDGMLSRRVGASATTVGGAVLVVGGAQDERATAHEAFEIFDLALGRFDASRSDKLALGPRRDHGAIALPDGRVLVVGGSTAADAAPLRSAEIVDPATSRASGFGDSMTHARIRPRLLWLDSGALIVAGGWDGPDPATRRAVSTLERVDLERGRFESIEPIEPADALPTHDEAVAAALEGERVAWFGCAARPAEPERRDCRLDIALLDGGIEVVTALDSVQLDGGDDACAPDEACDLEQLRMLALPDGRLLLTGRARGRRRAFLLDPRAPSVEATEASPVPEHLLRLADGTVAALDAFGASLARFDASTPFDAAPPDLFDRLVPDDPARFRERWLAERAGRLDVPGLRFGDLRIELELAGGGALWLEPEASPVARLVFDEERLALGGCELPRSGEAVALTRRGQELAVEAGGMRCAARAPSGHVSVALRLEAGAALRALRIERL